MVSETVNRVLSAEADSDKMLKDAQLRSDKIAASAEKYAQEAVEKQISSAKAECEAIAAEYERKTRLFQEQTNEKCAAEINRIKQQAEKNMPDAVNAVISKFFSGTPS